MNSNIKKIYTMKNTTHTFPLQFTRLISINVFFLLIVALAKAELFPPSTINESLNSAIAKSVFYSKENIRLNLNENAKYLIVLKNNHNCINCFEQLNDFVRLNKNNLKAKFIVVAEIDSTTLDRKRSYYENKKLMPDFDDYLFQYACNTNKNIFKNLNTNYTPEIIILNHGEINYIPYAKIFDHTTLNISLQTQIDISHLLK
jgi:hypothetical protein